MVHGEGGGGGGGGTLALIALHLPLVTYSLKGLPISGVVSLGSLKLGNFSFSSPLGSQVSSWLVWHLGKRLLSISPLHAFDASN